MPVLHVGQQITVGQTSISVVSELGNGAFGTVYKVMDARRKVYALKAVVCKKLSALKLVIREANTLAKANHQRIVKILDAGHYRQANDISLCLMLTEFCSGGDLNSRLNNSSTKQLNRKWILQISEALSYLHSLTPPIVHRDLKADNVLLTDPITQDLKLGDFGLAREYLAMKIDNTTAQSAHMYYMSSGLGPRHWMAPEFYNQHYTEKADIFSLGGIFFAILTRDFIVCDGKKMYGVYANSRFGKVGLGYAMANVDSSAVVSFPPCFQGSNAMMRLIQKMLSYDPKVRPSASQVYTTIVHISSSESLSNESRSLRQQTTTCCY